MASESDGTVSDATGNSPGLTSKSFRPSGFGGTKCW